MPCPVLILPIAAVEIRAVFQWYQQRRAGLGEAFLTEVRYGIEAIAAAPERHRLVVDTARRRRLRRFPYQIIFHDAGMTGLRILALAHERREPLYWIGRLPHD